MSAATIPKNGSAEPLDKKTIDHWSRYLRHRFFENPKEARDFIFRRLEESDRTFPGARYGKKKNRHISKNMPVYQLKKGWKVGRPVRNSKPRWSWKNTEIQTNNLTELYHTAEANGFTHYEYRRRVLLKIEDLGITATPEEDNRYGFGAELSRIRRLAEEIKESGIIECVIAGKELDENNPWLVEGQHRARAARWFLKQKTIPADLIEETPVDVTSP
jgi:hypothetical protein